VTAAAGGGRSILSSSLFDLPGAASMARGVPRPDASRRLRRAAEGKGGAAWHRDRTHAQPPLGGEHGEHGEDPPLARSEHRGTALC